MTPDLPVRLLFRTAAASATATLGLVALRYPPAPRPRTPPRSLHRRREEFVLLLVDVEEEAAMVAVERIRQAVARLSPPRVPCPVTASGGVAIHYR